MTPKGYAITSGIVFYWLPWPIFCAWLSPGNSVSVAGMSRPG